MPSNLADKRLGAEDCEGLIREFAEAKLREAVCDCEGSKSPGPDRFNFKFFKNCWDIMKGNLLRMLNEFHTHGKLARGCNLSFIVLIPKKEGACGISHFWPISLICSWYKVLAKVLAKD